MFQLHILLGTQKSIAFIWKITAKSKFLHLNLQYFYISLFLCYKILTIKFWLETKREVLIGVRPNEKEIDLGSYLRAVLPKFTSRPIAVISSWYRPLLKYLWHSLIKNLLYFFKKVTSFRDLDNYIIRITNLQVIHLSYSVCTVCSISFTVVIKEAKYFLFEIVSIRSNRNDGTLFQPFHVFQKLLFWNTV